LNWLFSAELSVVAAASAVWHSAAMAPLLTAPTLPVMTGVVLAAVVWLLVLLTLDVVLALVFDVFALLVVEVVVVELLLPPQPAISAAQSVATRNSGRNLRFIACPLSIAAHGRRLRR
jgi:hypothetical protein